VFLKPQRPRSGRCGFGSKFREEMSGHWFEKVKELNPAFPECVRHLRDINDMFEASYGWGIVSNFTPLGWVLHHIQFYKRRLTLRVLLDAGANPNRICTEKGPHNDGEGRHPLQWANDVEDARLLLEAGAVYVFQRSVRLELFRSISAARMAYDFYQDSLRATALVWCIEALRGSSSWPDMSLLLTKIIMDVSK
jgi:hypothetical protein